MLHQLMASSQCFQRQAVLLLTLMSKFQSSFPYFLNSVNYVYFKQFRAIVVFSDRIQLGKNLLKAFYNPNEPVSELLEHNPFHFMNYSYRKARLYVMVFSLNGHFHFSPPLTKLLFVEKRFIILFLQSSLSRWGNQWSFWMVKGSGVPGLIIAGAQKK